jgi:hypothetical protein
MGQKLRPDQLELYKRIDEILWNDWDPIGVSGSSDGRDEYYAYLPHVFRMALKNTAPSSIAEYLNNVAANRMGLNLPMERHLSLRTVLRVEPAQSERLVAQ